MVSIIIPIYNASKYISKCYEYILAQTYTNWEVIFVNDGSKDNSKSLLEELADKDKRISVIHIENSGPGIARNVGLNVAKGDWVLFFDADDKISSNLLQKCLEKADAFDAEVVMYGFDAYDTYSQIHTYSEFNDLLCKTNNEIGQNWSDFIKQSVIGNGFPWNKLYKRKLLIDNMLSFGDERVMEDEIFNLKVLRATNCMVVINDILYIYYCNNIGNSRTKFISNRFEILKKVRDEMLCCFNYWNLNNLWLIEHIERRFWAGIKKTLIDDSFHPENCLTKSVKKKRFIEISHDIDVITCFSRLKELELGIEDKLYIRAIRSKKYLIFSFVAYIYRLLRVIKKKVKYYGKVKCNYTCL